MLAHDISLLFRQKIALCDAPRAPDKDFLIFCLPHLGVPYLNMNSECSLLHQSKLLVHIDSIYHLPNRSLFLMLIGS